MQAGLLNINISFLIDKITNVTAILKPLWLSKAPEFKDYQVREISSFSYSTFITLYR